jgi:predicted RND superfamily exporter protein
MKKGYLHGSLYALAALFIVIWMTLRRLRETFLTLIPLAFTVLWTLGWMGWLDIPFNLANVIAIPLILGIVIDDGIHVIHRYRENPGQTESLISGSTAQAITLTSWTTMIGFGSLLISGHLGIFSLGLVVVVAVGAAWILSLVLLPVVLSYLKK